MLLLQQLLQLLLCVLRTDRPYRLAIFQHPCRHASKSSGLHAYAATALIAAFRQNTEQLPLTKAVVC